MSTLERNAAYFAMAHDCATSAGQRGLDEAISALRVLSGGVHVLAQAFPGGLERLHSTRDDWMQILEERAPVSISERARYAEALGTYSAYLVTYVAFHLAMAGGAKQGLHSARAAVMWQLEQATQEWVREAELYLEGRKNAAAAHGVALHATERGYILRWSYAHGIPSGIAAKTPLARP